MNGGAIARIKPLFVAAEIQAGFGEGDAGNGAHFGINFEQQIEVLLDRDSEGIDLVIASPIGHSGFFRSQAQLL